MLTGEYRHTIDHKGRLIIPSKLRNEFNDSVVITRGLDGCLFVYDLKTWDSIIAKLNTLSFTKKNVRSFVRFFTSGAITLEFDKQGRINIPNYLTNYASLSGDIIIIGVINRLEIWNLDNWNNYINNSVSSLSDISENLFDSSLEL